MRLEWDPKKNYLNYQKHRVRFEEAARVFNDRSSLSLYDEEHAQSEDRWITIGRTPSGSIIVVVHTYRKTGSTEAIRIISARRATKKEIQQYHEKEKHF